VPELICQNCHTPNQVHSEYLVFCQGCGKKLKGTFAEWKKQNLGGTFVQYTDHLNETEKQRKSAAASAGSGKSLKGKMKGMALLLTALLLGGYFIYRNYSPAAGGLRLTPGNVMEKQWKRYTCGRFGLSVELPGKLVNARASGKDQQETEAYSYSPEKGFQADLISIRYKDKTIGIEEAVNEAVNTVLNQPGVTGVKYEVIPFTNGDIPGLLVRGTLEREGIREVFYSAVYVKTVNVWQVHLRHLWGDETGAEAASRVLESVEINYFGTPI
jgi:hypothetical protein